MYHEHIMVTRRLITFRAKSLFIVRIIRKSGVPRNFVRGGGFNKIQLRTEGREIGDLGAVAPYSGVLEAAVIW